MSKKTQNTQLANELNKILMSFSRIYEVIKEKNSNSSWGPKDKEKLHYRVKKECVEPFEELVKKSNSYQYLNQVVANSNILNTLGEEGVRILLSYIGKSYLDEGRIQDLNKRVKNSLMSKENIREMIREMFQGEKELAGLKTLEDFIGAVKTKEAMEILNHLYVYVSSGNYQKDNPESIQEVFENINNNSLSPNKIFTIENGFYKFNMADAGVIDAVCVDDEGNIISSDTTSSRNSLIENDSIIRHNLDIIIVERRFNDLLSKGRSIKEAIIELRNTKIDLDKERELFKEQNPNYIELLHMTEYSLVHNSTGDEDEEVLLMFGYVYSTYKTDSSATRLTIEQSYEYFKSLEFKMVGSRRDIRLSDREISNLIDTKQKVFDLINRVVRSKMSQSHTKKDNLINTMAFINSIFELGMVDSKEFVEFLTKKEGNMSIVEMLARTRGQLKLEKGQDSTTYINTLLDDINKEVKRNQPKQNNLLLK